MTISRASGTLTFPANFQLIAAMNPCPCGYCGDPTHNCSCSPAIVTRYQKRISGPLLDRFDIHIDVPRVDYEKLASDRASEPSEAVRQRVLSAREKQLARFDGSGLTCNADMGPAHIREYCELDETSKALMRSAMNQPVLLLYSLRPLLAKGADWRQKLGLEESSIAGEEEKR